MYHDKIHVKLNTSSSTYNYYNNIAISLISVGSVLLNKSQQQGYEMTI